MKTILTRLTVLVLTVLLHSEIANAADRYVSLFGNSTLPYTNWVTAATNIQLAIDVAVDGETVWVAPGIYNSGFKTNSGGRNRVLIDKPIKVHSSQGSSQTIIEGVRDDLSNQVRCVWLGSNAVLNGFTIRNGGAQSAGWLPRGGGIFMQEGAKVDNCIIRNCVADSGGGIAGTTFTPYGDGLHSNYCVVSNSLVEANAAVGFGDALGGGALGIRIVDSIIQSNRAGEGGGLANIVAERCVIRRNTAGSGAGAVGDDALPGMSKLFNCLIVENGASGHASGIKGDGGIIAYNCTLSNYSTGSEGHEALDAGLVNCLIESGWKFDVFGSGMSSSLRTNDPYLFINLSGGDYRLHPASPAINAGSNGNFTAEYNTNMDIRGLARVVGTVVDVGAYEFQGECDGGIPSYWLSDYAISTNQTENFLDPDNDTFNTWHEFIAQTIPTNSQSYPRLIGHIDDNQNSPILTWAAYSNRMYTIQSLGALTSSWHNTFSVSVTSNHTLTLVLTNSSDNDNHRLVIELSK